MRGQRTLLALVGLLAAPIGPAIAQAPLVIRNVTVIDGEAPAPLHDMTVVISGGRFSWIGPSGTEPTPVAARVIEATGKVLIPGLWDTHAHLSYWGEDALDSLVVSGVTSIRELGGDPVELAAWKAAIDGGVRPGPRMVWCGPFLEGPDGGAEYRRYVTSVDDARGAVEALDRLGVDFLKIQPRIAPDLVAVLVEEGRARGLDLVGHLPHGVSAIEGARLGIRSIEHLSPYGDLSPEALAATWDVYREMGTWMSPALYSLVAPVEARGDDPNADPRVQWAYGVVVSAYEAGVPILVGANFAFRDWPQRPGSGLHGEMRALVAAGIPAMDVLRLATREAALFADREDLGLIREGMLADAVLLNADPIARIENAADISLVIQDGRVLVEDGAIQPRQ